MEEEITREEQKEQLDFDAKIRDTVKMGVRKSNMLFFVLLVTEKSCLEFLFPSVISSWLSANDLGKTQS